MLVAMTIAGSDSSGGAGLQADLKAFASEGVHGAVAITAVTAQNTQRVAGIHPLPAEQVLAQIDAVLEDVHVSAAKTGMLYSGAIARAVAGRLRDEGIPLVVDPVMVAGVGDKLSLADLTEAVRDELAPIATILTPNLPEAEVLLGRAIEGEDDAMEACRELSALGSEAVLLKGGHAEGPTCRDILFHGGRFTIMEHARVPIRGHGGGCTLAALLAANLAKGLPLPEAVARSNEAVRHAVVDNYPIGHGVPVVNPLSPLYRGAYSHEASEKLLAAAREAACLMPGEWVAPGGSELVYALPSARRPGDICSLEAPIVSRSGRALLPAGVAFGASRRMTAVVLAAMARDGGMRSAISIRHSGDVAALLRDRGMRALPIRRASIIGGENSTDTGLKTGGIVPDAVFDLQRPGGGPIMYLLGREPAEVLDKLRKLVE
jgi:hydroxymethylpyrimidine kinase/phosphomethylpyrimidine kinase